MKDNLNTDRRGMMIVLSSPSGAGKTSLSRKLLEKIKIYFYLYLLQLDHQGLLRLMKVIIFL